MCARSHEEEKSHLSRSLAAVNRSEQQPQLIAREFVRCCACICACVRACVCIAGITTALGGAAAIEGLVPRSQRLPNDIITPSAATAGDGDDNDEAAAPAADQQQAAVIAAGVAAAVRLLEREGYGSDDLNLGEGDEARFLLVLHAAMREATMAPLANDEAEVVEAPVLKEDASAAKVAAVSM